MKKQLLQLTAILIMASAVNAQDLGTIIIRNGHSSYPPFIISLNGVRLVNEYATTSTYSFLDGNKYEVKLLQSGVAGIRKFTITSDPRYLSKYVINKDNYGNYSMILENKSLMEDVSIPSIDISITKTVVTPTVVVPPTQTLAVQTPNIKTTNKAVTTQSTEVVAPVEITNMASAEFNERLAAVKKTSFDKDKLAKAKQVFDDEYLSTNQVMEVVKVFSFDDIKLDFAKWAYKNTTDKKNYYKVEDRLSFGSSKTELRNYVKSQPK